MYKESQRPEDAEETYNFEFEYVGSDKKTPRLVFGSKAELLEEENAIFSDTRRMLRRIILLTQDLPPLPLGMYLTIVLTYNDVAPVDYNPPGYKTDNLNFKVEEEAQPSILGTVTSRFHKLKTVVHSRGWVEGELQSSSQKSVGVSQKQPLDTPKSSQESVPHTPTSQVDTQCETRLTSSVRSSSEFSFKKACFFCRVSIYRDRIQGPRASYPIRNRLKICVITFKLTEIKKLWLGNPLGSLN